MDTQTKYYISITPIIWKGTIKINVFLVNAVIDFSPESINDNTSESQLMFISALTEVLSL